MDNCPLSGKPCNKFKGFHISEIQGSKVVSFDLCEDCVGKAHEGIKTEKKEVYKCENCGMTLEQFLANSNFGCDNCYTKFSSASKGMIAVNQSGGISHKGKVPKKHKEKPSYKSTNVKSAMPSQYFKLLEGRMQHYVNLEQYESAAIARDALKELEFLAESQKRLVVQLEDAVYEDQETSIVLSVKNEIEKICVAAEAIFLKANKEVHE